MENQNKGMSRASISPVRQRLDSITSMQTATRDIYAEQRKNEELASAQNMFECSLRTDDSKTKKMNLSGSNMGNMSVLIKDYYQSEGNHDCDTLDEGGTICYFLNRNPEAEKITNAALKGESNVDLSTWANRVGIDGSEIGQTQDEYLQDFYDNRDGKGKSWGGVALGGVGVGAALNTAAYPVGRGLELGGEYVYNSMFRPTQDASSQIVKKGGRLDFLKSELETAEKNLKAAEQSGAPTKALEERYGQVKERYEAAKKAFEGIETTSETASKYGIGKGLFKNWTFEGWGRQAFREAENLWLNKIEPAILRAEGGINIDEITKGLWKKIEPKLKYDAEGLEDFKAAYKQILEWYTGDLFKNVPAADAREIKSRLQGEVEDLYVKGKGGVQKNIAPAIKKLKSMLASEVKDAFHKLLRKAGLADSETMFLDWWNLTDIADRMAGINANGSVLGNTIDKNIQAGFKNIVFTKGSNFVKRLGTGIKKTSWINLLKKGAKGGKNILLGLFDPAFLIAEEAGGSINQRFGQMSFDDFLGGVAADYSYNKEMNKMRDRGSYNELVDVEEPSGEQLIYEGVPFEGEAQQTAIENMLKKKSEKELEEYIKQQDWYKALVEEEDATPLLEMGWTEEDLMELLNELE